MNDLFDRIFLKLCLHGAVSFATWFAWLLLGMFGWDEGFHTGMWVCIFVANCTALILSKLNRILERLPEDQKNSNP